MFVGIFRYKLIVSLYRGNLFLLSLDNNDANRSGYCLENNGFNHYYLVMNYVVTYYVILKN